MGPGSGKQRFCAGGTMKHPLRVLTLACALVSVGALAGKVAGDQAEDKQLKTRVQAALSDHEATGVHVEVYRGVVQLSGFVKSDAEREAAYQLASIMNGVKEVSDQLAVQSSERDGQQVADDALVADTVRSRLKDNDGTDGFDIRVDVREGVVLLSGFVRTDDERQEAVRTAQAVQGVISVINGMDLLPVG